MSHGPHIPHEPSPNWGEENSSESFGQWARRQIPFIITQVISLLLAVGSFIYYVGHSEEKITELISIEQAENLMYYLNLAFCTFCVIKLVTIYEDNSFGEFTARKVYKRVFQTELTLGEHRKRRRQSMYLLGRFKLYFLCFWIVMVALYAAFTVKTFTPESPGKPEGKIIRQEKAVKDFYFINDEHKKIKDSIVQEEKHSVFDYGTEEELGLIKNNEELGLTKDTSIPGVEQIIFHSKLEVLGHKWDSMLTYSLNTISIMFILWCFAVTALGAQKPSNFKRQPLLIYLSLFFTAILVALYPLCIGLISHGHGANLVYYEDSFINYSVLFDAISGVVNAVVLALFIARLDSKFVSLPSKLIGALYLYAGVQPLFVVFDLPGFVSETIKVSVLFLVFFLKIYFFFIITYAVQKGKIFTYLYCFSTLNERVESIIENSYEIHILHEGGNFNFNIYIADFMMFEGHCSCTSEEKCLSTIKDLKSLASLRGNYYIENVAEAFYIHIKEENKKLYCSSHLSITSDKEGEEIISEAMEKIPYCGVVLHKPH